MHSYEVDGDRHTVVGIIGGISVLLVIALFAIIYEVLELALPWYVDMFIPISPLGVFTALYYAFDHYLWKAPLIRRVVSIPDLNGVWEGEVRSSYCNGEGNSLTPIEPAGSKLEIKQRWSRIEIYYRNPNSSHSISEIARFATSQSSEPQIKYTYANTPEGDGQTTQNSHGGTAELRLITDSDGSASLRGSYYTNQDRSGNYGDMQFERL